MDETRAWAELPNLDIEITHRRLPDEDAEYLTVSLRATPSFGAMGRFLEARGPMMWPWLVMAPWAIWAQLAHAAWAPWLAGGPRRLEGAARPETLPGPDRTEALGEGGREASSSSPPTRARPTD